MNNTYSKNTITSLVFSLLVLTGCATGYRSYQSVQEPVEEKKLLYKDLMIEMTREMSQSLPANTRIAVLKIPSNTGQETRFSSNLATKLEMGFLESGQEIVDRARIEQVFKEQNFQQGDAALFDAAKSARLGKFVGANVVVGGEYFVVLPKKIVVTTRAVSVETTKVIAIKEKEIPLSDEGADNWEPIVELLRTESL